MPFTSTIKSKVENVDKWQYDMVIKDYSWWNDSIALTVR